MRDHLLGVGNDLGLQHFGLAMPTLEEVFLRVTSAAAAAGAALDPLGARPPAALDPLGARPPAAKQNGRGQAHTEISCALELGPVRKGGVAPFADTQPVGQGTNRRPERATAGISTEASPLVGSSTDSGAFTEMSPARAAGTGKEGDERTGFHRGLVAFREMLRKRALIASRDKKGAVFTLLLPVLAVAFVLVSTAVSTPNYGRAFSPPLPVPFSPCIPYIPAHHHRHHL